MCDNAILKNDGTLKTVPDSYKNLKICNKTDDNYPHAFEFVPKYFMNQKMCYKVVNAYPPIIKIVPECFITQEMSNKAVKRWFFVFVSIPD